MKDSWFFGNSGLNRLKEVNESFKKKAINQINFKNNYKFSFYSPWMSNYDERESLKAIYGLKEKILTSSAALELIESKYHPPEDKTKLISISSLTDTKLNKLKAALEMIASQGNDISSVFNHIVKHIVPLKTKERDFQDIGIGFSSHLARGAIFLSIPFLDINSVKQLAVNIAHETGHQALYIYQTADPIIENGLSTPVYSYVRKTDRPAIQSFHATVALAFMARFINQLSSVEHDNYLKEVLNTISDDFKKSLEGYKNVTFTEFGKLLLDDLRSYANKI